MMNFTQQYITKLENTMKTIVKAGIDFKDIKIAARNQKNGYISRVIDQPSFYDNVIRTCQGDGMPECGSGWYETEEKGKVTKYFGGFDITNDWAVLENVNKMNAEEFIIAFYDFLKHHGDTMQYVEFYEGNRKSLKGSKFCKKDMTLYINY